MSVYEGILLRSPVLATNRWYHVAAVLDDWNGDGLKSNDLRLYIDGKQVTGSYYNPNEALSTKFLSGANRIMFPLTINLSVRSMMYGSTTRP